jgi:hypothetical protein
MEEREKEMQFIFLYYHHFIAMNLIFFVREFHLSSVDLKNKRERERKRGRRRKGFKAHVQVANIVIVVCIVNTQEESCITH